MLTVYKYVIAIVKGKQKVLVKVHAKIPAKTKAFARQTERYRAELGNMYAGSLLKTYPEPY